jgi:hypothetical protein
MVWRGAGGQVCIVMLRRRIDRGLGGGAADEPIFGLDPRTGSRCVAVFGRLRFTL